jgi:hypothetical protein
MIYVDRSTYHLKPRLMLRIVPYAALNIAWYNTCETFFNIFDSQYLHFRTSLTVEHLNLECPT